MQDGENKPGSNMETHDTTPSESAALNELDPRVQTELFQRIQQQVAQQIRESLAASFPGTGFPASMNPPTGPSHAAGSQASLDAMNQATPGTLAEVNFNWGSTVASMDAQVEEDVSIFQDNNSQKYTSQSLKNTELFCNLQKGLSPYKGRPKRKRKRTSSGSPTNNKSHANVGGKASTQKKRKMVSISPSRNLKQSKLSQFFPKMNEYADSRIIEGEKNKEQNQNQNHNQNDSQNQENREITNGNKFNEENLSHLLALDTECTNENLGNSQASNETFPDKELSRRAAICDQLKNIIDRTKKRESILFKETNPADKFPLLDQNGRVDDDKLSLLIREIEEHNNKLFDLSIIRAKQQAYQKEREPQQGLPNVLDKISSSFTKEKNKNKKCPTEQSGNEPVKKRTNHVFSSIQEGESAMTDSALSTWNKSRTAAVDASKANTRAKFYREAPKKNLMEYWTYGLEKTPGYLMKLPAFRKSLQEMRTTHAREIMNLAADHLEKEVTRNNGSAASIKSAAIKQVYETNPPEVAQRIITCANLSYDITISNMSNNEFRDLERRRQALERAPPTAGDILDPAANVARTTARAPPSGTSNTQNPTWGFHQRGRGRGRGGPRPWRNQRGRKPYDRTK